MPRNVSGNKRKVSADMTEDPPPPPTKKPRYNMRKRNKPAPPDDTTIWVQDDTLSSDEDDSDYEGTFVITTDGGGDFLNQLFASSLFVNDKAPKKAAPKKKGEDPILTELTRPEKKYYQQLRPAERRTMLDAMKRLSALEDEGGVPLKFKILQLPVSDHMKSLVLKKLDALEDMSMDSGGAYKLKSWVDGFLKIPFGKTVPLPVNMTDGVQKCSDYMVSVRREMDAKIYGMKEAKAQIMQIMSQWIVNPGSVGNVIALHGPMGTGKTSLARNAIASALKRPFGFFTLGGASDIANFVGHSYTYEGSTWGRIADTLMQCGTMNPVMYFDELDKVSATPHGEEIISMLIHLTDRSQNTEFHDRYFSGVEFDMSQCLFVFSCNDMEKVHPILRDRMTVIECGGYTDEDKKHILKEYMWPEFIERLRFAPHELIFEDDAMKFIISEYSHSEKGVRNLIRTVETCMTRLNMLRISKHESMKEYPFYMDVSFPLRITPKVIQTLLKDTAKVKQDDTWRMMYT